MITLACFWEYVPYSFRKLIIWSFLGLRQVCSIESASPSSLWPLCSSQLVADVYCGRHSVLVLGAFAKWRKEIISSVMSVRPSVRPRTWNSWATTGRISMKYIWVFLKKYVEKLRCMKTNVRLWYRSFLLRMRNVSMRSGWENRNTHFMFNNLSFLEKSCHL